MRFLLTLALCILLGIAAPSAQEVQTGFAEPYRIGVDDQVSVNVWRNPELSVSVPVRPDGMISVPLVGDVMAGGRKPTDVAADIARRLEQYIRNPNVTVIVTDLRSHEFLSRVRVTGAVVAPSSMAHRQGMTVLDAVLEVGGVNEFASADKTKVYRKTADGTTVITVELGKILKKGDLKTNINLKPGDIITVPERFF